MLWRIMQIAAWPPMTYCLSAMVLIAKWTIWFPVMVLRHGRHGAIDAALAGRTDPGAFQNVTQTTRVVPAGLPDAADRQTAIDDKKLVASQPSY
jgi:hypothetical protein